MFTREHGTAGWSASIPTLFSLSRKWLSSSATRNSLPNKRPHSEELLFGWGQRLMDPAGVTQMHTCEWTEYRRFENCRFRILKTPRRARSSKILLPIRDTHHENSLRTIVLSTLRSQSVLSLASMENHSAPNKVLSFIMLPKAIRTTNGESIFLFLAIEVSNDSRTTQYLVGGSDL